MPDVCPEIGFLLVQTQLKLKGDVPLFALLKTIVLGGVMAEFQTLKLAKEYYQIGKSIKLPKGLKDQFTRSSSSVALNLAEGNAKSSKRDRLRIFEIARGSFLESKTILELEDVKDQNLLKIMDRLGAALYKLTKSLQ
jgi:four helix bundle protein